MELEIGMEVKVHGRYEDFTDHLEGCTVRVIELVDSQGYVYVKDEEDFYWYVRVEDLYHD